VMKIELNKSLYRVAAVREAAASFRELATISVSASGEKIVVTLAHPAEDVELKPLCDEFLNHALAATIARRGA